MWGLLRKNVSSKLHNVNLNIRKYFSKDTFTLLFSAINNNFFVIRGKTKLKLEACLLKLYFFFCPATQF